MKKYRVIVAHAGQQTSFRRAEALKKGDMLHKYITTVYLKKEKMASLGLLKKIARKEYDRLILRNCPSLDDTEVVQYDVIQNLILIAINRVAKLKKLYINLNLYLSKKFAKKVASYAKKENVDALIMMGAAPAAAAGSGAGHGLRPERRGACAHFLFLFHRPSLAGAGPHEGLFGRPEGRLT